MTSPYANPAHEITLSTADPHSERVKWMESAGIKAISTCPSGETVLTHADGRQTFGHARDMLPFHVRWAR
jgi:hypothetical protein